jgi:hypothetical protein
MALSRTCFWNWAWLRQYRMQSPRNADALSEVTPVSELIMLGHSFPGQAQWSCVYTREWVLSPGHHKAAAAGWVLWFSVEHIPDSRSMTRTPPCFLQDHAGNFVCVPRKLDCLWKQFKPAFLFCFLFCLGVLSTIIHWRVLCICLWGHWTLRTEHPWGLQTLKRRNTDKDIATLTRLYLDTWTHTNWQVITHIAPIST